MISRLLLTPVTSTYPPKFHRNMQNRNPLTIPLPNIRMNLNSGRNFLLSSKLLFAFFPWLRHAPIGSLKLMVKFSRLVAKLRLVDISVIIILRILRNLEKNELPERGRWLARCPSCSLMRRTYELGENSFILLNLQHEYDASIFSAGGSVGANEWALFNTIPLNCI